MKKKIYKSICYCLTLTTLLQFSCSNNDDDEPTKAKSCKLTEEVTNPGDKTTYEYDNTSGKIVKIIYDDKESNDDDYTETFTYGENTVTMTNTDSEDGYTTIYTIGANGYASSSVDQSEGYESHTTYTYNSEGYLTKEVTEVDDEPVSEIVYEVNNGNVDKFTYSAEGYVYEVVYEYSDIKIKQEMVSTVYFTGKTPQYYPSKAVTTIVYNDFESVETSNYTYKLDEDGKVTERTTISIPENGEQTTTVSTLNYSCN